MTFMLRPLDPGDISSCADILAALPEWFGLPEANAAYIEELRTAPAFVATDGDRQVVGFVALTTHGPSSMRIEVMGVRREHHGVGIGRRLVEAAVAHARGAGARWLHVMTRGPSTYDDDYEKTRRFYHSVGFEGLYESLTEWGPEDAALILVMYLGER